MAFTANFKDPKSGYVYPKADIYVKVTSNGSEKVSRIKTQADNKTPVIDEQTGKPAYEYVWLCRYRFMVFSRISDRPIFVGEGMMTGYNPNEPAEKQLYNEAKKLVRYKTADWDETWNLFTDIEDDEDVQPTAVVEEIQEV